MGIAGHAFLIVMDVGCSGSVEGLQPQLSLKRIA